MIKSLKSILKQKLYAVKPVLCDLPKGTLK